MYGVLSISFMSFVHGCATATPKSDDRLVNNNGYYKIYKNENQRFCVIQDGKTVHQNLNYASAYGDSSVVALDAKNKVKILKLKQPKQTNSQNELLPLECGNGEYTHRLTVEKKNDHLDLMAMVGVSGEMERVVQKNKRIVSIPRAKADRIFFAENRSKMEIDSETIGPVYLYFQKGTHYGFLGKVHSVYENEKFIYTFTKSKNTMLYDGMQAEYGGNVSLYKNGLAGYYFREENRMIAIKYKSFQAYNFTYGKLARFELPNGRKGYVDRKGNEYYD